MQRSPASLSIRSYSRIQGRLRYGALLMFWPDATEPRIAEALRWLSRFPGSALFLGADPVTLNSGYRGAR